MQLIIDFQQPIERIQKSIPIQINEQKRLIQQELSKNWILNLKNWFNIVMSLCK
jgi:hypothetical protein